MMNRPATLSALAALVFAVSAHAAPRAPNVSTTISAPSGVLYGANARYTVQVSNVGNATASSVAITVQLPRTNTSPTVHVLGDLGAMHPSCTRSGTTLQCTVTNLRAGRSASVYFDIAIPYSAAPVALSASAVTAGDSNTGNNTASRTLSLAAQNVSVNPTRNTFIRHCTGTNLISFFECELYPSSLMEHESVLHADGSITFPADPVYGGSWSQPAPNRLVMTYTEGAAVVATFDGYGVDGCFEGRTTFPGSTYVSMYQVCLR
jgi:uncharacterized repeat protein (TIGR01451 family)